MSDFSRMMELARTGSPEQVEAALGMTAPEKEKEPAHRPEPAKDEPRPAARR